MYVYDLSTQTYFRPDSAQETFRRIVLELPFANLQTEKGLHYDRGSYVIGPRTVIRRLEERKP